MNKNIIQLKTEQGQYFDIPEGGSLGLLALGYAGLMLWREKRQEIQKQALVIQEPENESIENS